MPEPTARPIYLIAAEIRQQWPKPYFGAAPYIRAMLYLKNMFSNFGDDTARDVVLHFLGNANTWRGEHARRIKAELNSILKG